ncbi:MAG: hypothetical protein WCX22_00430 [Methanoregula sp.]
MMPKCRFLAVLILLAVFIIITGCILQNPALNSTNTTISYPPVSPTPDQDMQQTQPRHPATRTDTVMQGEPFIYTGIVPRERVPSLDIWMFCRDYSNVTNIPVQVNGSFNFTLNGSETGRLTNGTCHITLLFPGTPERAFLNVVSKEDTEDTSGTVWIHIDPVNEKYVNTSYPLLNTGFGITGTTNLPVGEQLNFTIQPDWIGHCARSSDPRDLACGEKFAEIVTVRAGTGGVNTWSIDVDTVHHYFRVHEGTNEAYYVRVASADQTDWDEMVFNIRVVGRTEEW